MLQVKGPERSFSAMRIVKSHLKFTVGQERLNSFMVLHVHKEYNDKTDVGNEFSLNVQDGRVYLGGLTR